MYKFIFYFDNLLAIIYQGASFITHYSQYKIMDNVSKCENKQLLKNNSVKERR